MRKILKILLATFSLTALFAVLLMEQVSKNKRVEPILTAVVAALISFTIFKGQHFLISSIGLTVLFLLFKPREKNAEQCPAH